MTWAAELVLIVLIGAGLRALGDLSTASRWVRGLLIAGGILVGCLALAGGILALLLGWPALGVRAVGGGLGVLLAWWPWYRRVVARAIPIHPDSILDALGLAVLQGSLGLLTGMLLWAESVPVLKVSPEQLAAQALAEVLLAGVVVGFPWRRDVRATARRLGLEWPDWRAIGGAILFTFVMFAVSAFGGWMANAIQPEVVARIQERMVPLATEFGSPLRALFLGVLAGIGEEILFRGAIQPRYGLLPTAVLFTLVHVQYELSIVTLFVFALGLVLGIERRLLGTTSCVITHALYDALAVLLQSQI